MPFIVYSYMHLILSFLKLELPDSSLPNSSAALKGKDPNSTTPKSSGENTPTQGSAGFNTNINNLSKHLDDLY